MDKLGIQPTQLMAQIVNFTIIMVVLSRFLYKPILSMLERRKKEIEEGLKLTQKMREEEEKFNSKKQKLLETTRKEAQEILEEARKQAKEEEKELVAGAHKEAELIIEKGREEVAQLRRDMEKEVEKSAVVLAVAMTKRLLGGVLSSSDQHKVLEKHIKQLESMKV